MGIIYRLFWFFFVGLCPTLALAVHECSIPDAYAMKKQIVIHGSWCLWNSIRPSLEADKMVTKNEYDTVVHQCHQKFIAHQRKLLQQNGATEVCQNQVIKAYQHRLHQLSKQKFSFRDFVNIQVDQPNVCPYNPKQTPALKKLQITWRNRMVIRGVMCANPFGMSEGMGVFGCVASIVYQAQRAFEKQGYTPYCAYLETLNLMKSVEGFDEILKRFKQ